MKLINKIFSKTNIGYLVTVLAMLVIVFGPIQKTISYYLLTQRLTTSTFALHIVKMLWGIGIILAIIYLLNVIFKRYKIKYTDICTFILIGITITSYFFSINKSVSLQGEIFRYEGLYTLLSYYMIFLNLKNIDNKNIKEYIVKLIIVMAIYQVVYGFFQVFMLSPFVYRFSIQHMASGLSANPNFFGSYTVMILALTVGLYLKTRRPVFQILSVVLMIGLTLSNSTGPFLSFLDRKSVV